MKLALSLVVLVAAVQAHPILSGGKPAAQPSQVDVPTVIVGSSQVDAKSGSQVTIHLDQRSQVGQPIADEVQPIAAQGGKQEQVAALVVPSQVGAQLAQPPQVAVKPQVVLVDQTQPQPAVVVLGPAQPVSIGQSIPQAIVPVLVAEPLSPIAVPQPPQAVLVAEPFLEVRSTQAEPLPAKVILPVVESVAVKPAETTVGQVQVPVESRNSEIKPAGVEGKPKSTENARNLLKVQDQVPSAKVPAVAVASVQKPVVAESPVSSQVGKQAGVLVEAKPVAAVSSKLEGKHAAAPEIKSTPGALPVEIKPQVQVQQAVPAKVQPVGAGSFDGRNSVTVSKQQVTVGVLAAEPAVVKVVEPAVVTPLGSQVKSEAALQPVVVVPAAQVPSQAAGPSQAVSQPAKVTATVRDEKAQ